MSTLESKMDEQAKRMAISFADYAGNHYHKSSTLWCDTKGNTYTTQQLYDKFLFEIMARLEEDI